MLDALMENSRVEALYIQNFEKVTFHQMAYCQSGIWGSWSGYSRNSKDWNSLVRLRH